VREGPLTLQDVCSPLLETPPRRRRLQHRKIFLLLEQKLHFLCVSVLLLVVERATCTQQARRENDMHMSATQRFCCNGHPLLSHPFSSHVLSLLAALLGSHVKHTHIQSYMHTLKIADTLLCSNETPLLKHYR
jgi:hypothetical protein